MRVLLRIEEQREILENAVKKAGSERKLEKELFIPKSSIYDYARGKRLLSNERFTELLKFIGTRADEYPDVVFLDDNWGRVKGGNACVESKKASGVFYQQLAEARKNSNFLKEWHVKLKEKNYEEYLEIQHARFRLAGLNKFKSMKGENVRNVLEKQVADFFFESGIEYEYEPHLKLEGKSYFPDFIVGSVLIECTMWRGTSKAEKLLKKIEVFERNGYKTVVLIPKNLQEFYKEIESHTIYNLEELKQFCCPGSSVLIHARRF